jgi:RNA polymerase sigma-70 factor (ECF subfamily)
MVAASVVSGRLGMDPRPHQVWPDLQALFTSQEHGEAEKALVVIFEGYRERLLRIAAVRLDWDVRKRETEADIVQRTWIEASRRLPEYLKDARVSPFAWLRGLTDQKARQVNHHHHAQIRNVRMEVPLEDRRCNDLSSMMIANNLVDDADSPSEMARRKELKGIIAEAIDALEPDDREIILLRMFEKLPRRETAEVLGISVVAVAQRQHRALLRLKEVLAVVPQVNVYLVRLGLSEMRAGEREEGKPTDPGDLPGQPS